MEKLALLPKKEWYSPDDLTMDTSLKKAYFMGAGIQANSSYILRALPIPDAKDQSAVLMVVEAEPIASLEGEEADLKKCEIFRVRLDDAENQASATGL